MKTFCTLILIITISTIINAQVGINTTSPQATIDIVASNVTTPSYKDGLIIPRMHAFPTTNPDVGQNAMMIFITGDGTATKGFYFWNNDNTIWTPLPGRDNSRMFLDPQYPDGMAGIQPISHRFGAGYTVPSGKNLYITNHYSIAGSGFLSINPGAHPIMYNQHNHGGVSSITNPIIVGSGEVVNYSGGSANINGFLVDAFVSPITIDPGSYTVPNGKILVILSTLALGVGPYLININSTLIYNGYGNAYRLGEHKINHSFFQPIFADAGDVITNPASSLNGYLMDK